MTTLTSQQRIGLVLLTLMWGLNWPIMKFSLRELPPLHFRALTMALGALMLALYFAWRGVRLRPRGWSEWRMVVLLGLPNVLAREFLVPELLQDECTPEALAAEGLAWLDEPERYARVQARFAEQHQLLRRNTAQLATDAIAQVIGL